MTQHNPKNKNCPRTYDWDICDGIGKCNPAPKEEKKCCIKCNGYKSKHYPKRPICTDPNCECHKEKNEGWKERFSRIIPKNVDILHEIKSDRIFCSRQAIVNFFSAEIAKAKDEAKKEILSGGRMKHYLETEIEKARQAGYDKGYEKTLPEQIVIAKEKIAQAKREVLEEIKEQAEKMNYRDDYVNDIKKDFLSLLTSKLEELK